MIPASLRAIASDPALRLAALAIILTGAFAASIGPYQSLLAIEVFGLSENAYSAILAIASTTAVVAALALGILTDQRANRRRVAILSASLLLASVVIPRLGMSATAFWLGHAILMPLGSTLFGQIFALTRLAAASRPTQERDAILAAMRALFALPFIIVLPIWSIAFRSGATLLYVYPVTGALGALCLLLILRAWPRDGGTVWADPKSGLSFAAALKEILVPHVAFRIFCLGAIMGGMTLYMALLGLVFSGLPGRGESATAIYAGVVAGLEVPVMLAVPLLTARFARTTLIAAGAATYTIHLVGMPLLAASDAVWLLTIPAAIGGGIVLSLPIAYLQDLVSTRPGMGGALIAVQRVVGDVLCAGAFALGIWVQGYATAALFGALIMMAAAAALLRADRQPGRGKVSAS
ncbi:MFS transporter [Ostreiculturibacter nitratireducens]|uniref:MFS transporter n=1 Tax=Ostreiculturibacter nitratireducens TaxID=3075226 RepID=UPI0031B58E9D